MNNRKFFACFGIIAGMLMLIAGCSKDKYDTRPSLKLKSVSSYDVPNGGIFTIRLEFTDAEGDLSIGDSALIILGTVRQPNCRDTTLFKYKLPEIPTTKNASGDIVIRYENSTSNYSNQGYQTYNPSTCISTNRPDTTSLRFFIKDKAGHTSDTVSLDRPIIIRP